MFQLQNVNTNRNAREKKNLINFNPAKASKSIMNESEAGGNISNSNLKWLCVNWMERNSIEQQRKLQRIWNWTIEWKIHPSFQLENKNGKKAAPTLCFQFQSQTECGQQNWTEEKYCHFGVANKGWERERMKGDWHLQIVLYNAILVKSVAGAFVVCGRSNSVAGRAHCTPAPWMANIIILRRHRR